MYREVIADTLTPLTAFLRLDRDPSQAAYLLESVEGGEKWGRYSFIGIRPRQLLRTSKDSIEQQTNGQWHTTAVPNALSHLCKITQENEPLADEALPRFWGGLVGYLGYDMIHCIEDMDRVAERDLPVWDSYLMEAGVVVILDALRQRAQIVCPVHIQDDSDTQAAWDSATRMLDEAATALATPVPGIQPALSLDAPPPMTDPPVNMANKDFEQSVLRAREYIKSGDIIQVVLSRRFDIPCPDTDPFQVYRALRLSNPSPYMFYIRFPEYTVVGASPEVMARRDGDTVEVRPIAGTRRRGSTPQEDQAIEEELRADPKEVAEHVMLLDLGRNDVGRISRTGTVQIPNRMVVERYSHVMHLVSGVTGQLKPDVNLEQVIRSVFPAGTLSGAPKVRAMEIIEELEPHGRGIYGGAAGYMGYDGNMDMAIAIRSLVAFPDTVHVQVGAGIVYDSRPERELEETREKSLAVLRAIAMVQGESS